MMPDASELRETQVESRRVYEGRVVNVRVDSVSLPDGKIRLREVVEHAPAVVIAAENEKGEVLLIDQFRYPVGRTIVELPAGIVERGEDAAAAAVRELQEETGWKPSKIERVFSFYTSPGFTTEELIFFYASGLTSEKLPQDDDEFIIPRFASRAEVEGLLASGGIADGKTLLGLYWWLRRNGNEKTR